MSTVNKKNDDILNDYKCFYLQEQAEDVTWKFSDINWQDIEKDKVTLELLDHVRTVVNLEFTTYPGAMNFFREFSDDHDFTQWVTLWLHEETRHPHILMKWLGCLSKQHTESDIATRRTIYPKGKSKIGTLSMNIISEMRATAWYLDLAAATNEPVLKDICIKLAADEARHAAGFYVYAKKIIETASDPDLERLRALEMLYIWLNSKTVNRHPAGLFFDDTDNQSKLTATTTTYSTVTSVDNRVCRMLGKLTGVPLKNSSEIKKYIRYFLSKHNATSTIV